MPLLLFLCFRKKPGDTIRDRIIGITGLVMVIAAYLLLWTTIPDAAVSQIVIRVRAAVAMTLFGNVMIAYSLYRRS